ncbi:MAG TPA: hypothetical protein VFG63_12405, partial [Nocardioidaceae bacterium]|nr:hypothetical protein [Nocardioidaceae bacterium]
IASTMRYLGGIAGIAVLSLMLDVTGSRADVVAEHRALMAFFAGALLVGLLCSAVLPGRTPTPPSREGGRPRRARRADEPS